MKKNDTKAKRGFWRFNNKGYGYSRILKVCVVIGVWAFIYILHRVYNPNDYELLTKPLIESGAAGMTPKNCTIVN